MHRTQIYLDDELHNALIGRAKRQNISKSELIRRLLTLQLKKKEEKSLTAEAFFQHMTPLESFAEQTPTEWVQELRANSRILR